VKRPPAKGGILETKEQILDEQHWQFDDYRQRITTKDWKTLLLNDDDRIIFRGKIMKLICKKLGCGVVEISKEEVCLHVKNAGVMRT
jgi:hypothetical protein